MNSIIADQEIYQKGYYYSLAITVLKDEVPAAWRQKANALLFASERPYIRLNP